MGYYPELVFYSPLGTIKPFFDGPSTPETLTMARFMGGLFLFLSFALFTVRWNSMNGKLTGFGLILAAINTVSLTMGMDNNEFVLRTSHLMALYFVLTALHLAFNANPMLTAAMLAEKEKAKKK